MLQEWLNAMTCEIRVVGGALITGLTGSRLMLTIGAFTAVRLHNTVLYFGRGKEGLIDFLWVSVSSGIVVFTAADL